MKGKCYYFYVRTGNYDKMEREYCHWEWTDRFTSKEKVSKHFSHGRQTVRKSEVYSAEQFIKLFSSKASLRRALEEAIKYSGKDGAY